MNSNPFSSDLAGLPTEVAAELEDRDYYTSENVFWVPEGARW